MLMKSASGRLVGYLASGIAASVAAGQCNAATVVTFYGPGAQNIFTTPATPLGINIGDAPLGKAINGGAVSGEAIFGIDDFGNYFTRGEDLNLGTIFGHHAGHYFYSGDGWVYGGEAGSLNYVNIDFNPALSGFDGTFEAVGQFYLDGSGGGYLIALAINDDNTALPISLGKAAIDAIPEPSGMALLTLGAAGILAARRRRQTTG